LTIQTIFYKNILPKGKYMDLNFDTHYVNNFWLQKSPQFAQLMTHMECVETWVLDKKIENHIPLLLLSEQIHYWSKAQLAQNTEDFFSLMKYLSSSKMFFFLHYLDRFPGLSIHFIMELNYSLNDTNNKNHIIIERLKLVDDLKLLSNVVTPMRSRLISNILNNK
jgi:hypothetical protein